MWTFEWSWLQIIYYTTTCYLIAILELKTELLEYHMQVHSSGNYISTVKSPPKHTSLPFTAAIFLATYLMVVLQPSGYSVFYSGDTSIQLGLPWWSYFCQCLNTETSAQGNRDVTTETPSISYTFCLYIRLVVTL